MLTRKDFKLFALLVSKIDNAEERKKTARLTAIVCSNANPLFNWTKYYAACGVNMNDK